MSELEHDYQTNFARAIGISWRENKHCRSNILFSLLLNLTFIYPGLFESNSDIKDRGDMSLKDAKSMKHYEHGEQFQKTKNKYHSTVKTWETEV